MRALLLACVLLASAVLGKPVADGPVVLQAQSATSQPAAQPASAAVQTQQDAPASPAPAAPPPKVVFTFSQLVRADAAHPQSSYGRATPFLTHSISHTCAANLFRSSSYLLLLHVSSFFVLLLCCLGQMKQIREAMTPDTAVTTDPNDKDPEMSDMKVVRAAPTRPLAALAHTHERQRRCVSLATTVG